MFALLSRRISRGVRLFALLGGLFAVSMELGWTPSEPWRPTVAAWELASEWAATRTLMSVGAEYLVILGRTWHGSWY